MIDEDAAPQPTEGNGPGEPLAGGAGDSEATVTFPAFAQAGIERAVLGKMLVLMVRAM